MIILDSITKSFGEREVLKGFSATFEKGNRYCIMGASGGGKTTLLNIILGLQKADSGRITGLPENISAVFQEDRLCEPYSAVANVQAVTGRSVPEEEIISLLNDLGLGGSEICPSASFRAVCAAVSHLRVHFLPKASLSCLTRHLRGLTMPRVRW